MLYRRKLIYFSISIIKSVRANINLDIIVLNFPCLWLPWPGVFVYAPLSDYLSSCADTLTCDVLCAYVLPRCVGHSGADKTIDVVRSCNIFLHAINKQQNNEKKNGQPAVDIPFHHILDAAVSFGVSCFPLLHSFNSFVFVWLSNMNFIFFHRVHNINFCFLSSSVFDPLNCSSHF